MDQLSGQSQILRTSRQHDHCLMLQVVSYELESEYVPFWNYCCYRWCISNPAAADAGHQYLPGGRGGRLTRWQARQATWGAPNNHLRRSVTFAGHFARNTTRIFNIWSVIYAPSWSASIRLGRLCRSTMDSTGGGRRAAPPAEQPAVFPALSPSGGRHPLRPDLMETI